MIMPIALAKDGFIEMRENPLFEVMTDFRIALDNMFYFEQRDLQDFDGNTCKIINAYDPTNSIFHYQNQQGIFLYQITSATPSIHKNNMIWFCNCLKIEDYAKLDAICQNGKSVQTILEKNIFRSDASSNLPFSKVEVKSNFKPMEVIQSRVGNNLCAFKIKCYVNPTGESLTNKSNDGSWNFFFPMLMFDRTTTSGEIETDITNAIALTNTTGALKLNDIISKYSQQIKSIEFIPFFPTTITEMGGGILNVTRNNSTTLYFDIIGNAVYTDLGIFIPQGHYSSSYVFTFDLPKFFLPKQLLKGGGARGFLRSPLGNIQLDFELNKYNIYNDFITYTLKDEGWKLDGACKCEVPPHYINFYTDNAGQVFIQNLTTNAQELRQLERETIAKQEEQQQQLVLDTLKTGTSIGSSLATLDFGGAIRGAGNLANLYVENEFNKAKSEREYQRSLIEFNDKVKTQSLLASLTGKQIGGNVNLLEFLESFNCNFFKIFIETNFSLQYANGGKHSFIIQKDYDYSTTNLPNPVNQNVGQLNNNKILTIFGETETPNYNSNLGEMFAQLFGFTTNQQIQFIDNIGLNYSIVFRLQNTIITGNEDLNNLEFSKTIYLPVRRKTKLLENVI